MAVAGSNHYHLSTTYRTQGTGGGADYTSDLGVERVHTFEDAPTDRSHGGVREGPVEACEPGVPEPTAALAFGHELPGSRVRECLSSSPDQYGPFLLPYLPNLVCIPASNPWPQRSNLAGSITGNGPHTMWGLGCGAVITLKCNSCHLIKV